MQEVSFRTANLQERAGDHPVCLRADLYQGERSLQELLHGLARHFGEEDECFSTANLPDLMRTHFPDLWEIARKIYGLLEHGVAAIIVEDLPFAQLDLTRSKRVLLAFAACIGRPISADHHRANLVWEVSPRPQLIPVYTPTITEHKGAAELHTDSAFKSSPEMYVLLFAHRPASDGGGRSKLLSADRLLSRLSNNSLGRECSRLLRLCAFPFRVPTVFTKHRRETDVEWITAPILSGRSQLRYRYDLIASALEGGVPSLMPEAQWALSHLRKEVQQLSPTSLSLARGDLLVLNNRLVLHGRTAFEDRERMLLRIRLTTTHSSHLLETNT